jgi:hypothetical protein
MTLVQTRECDFACCKSKPSFPDGKGSCLFLGKKGCKIMTGEANLPQGNCPALPEMTAQDGFNYRCRDWPDNMPGRDTGGCCREWIDGK